MPPTGDPEALIARNAVLNEFSVKPYLHSVKGYLDPASAFSLAAAALCLGDTKPAHPERTAVISVTQYGAPGSGFRFFEQMLQKGHHFASPLIFPHAYGNTAGNLVAIEFGLSGPHLAFDTATDAAEAWWAAADLVGTGQADDALLVLYEATEAAVLPNGRPVLNGALCCHLAAGDGPDGPSRPAVPGNRRGVLCPALGTWRWPAG